MTGRELARACTRIGHEKSLRKFVIEQSILTAEELAITSFEEVCDIIAEAGYMFLAEPSGDMFYLCKEEDYDKIMDMCFCISR